MLGKQLRQSEFGNLESHRMFCYHMRLKNATISETNNLNEIFYVRTQSGHGAAATRSKCFGVLGFGSQNGLGWYF